MPKQQLHKRFHNDHIRHIFMKYESRQMTAREAMRYLGIGHTRFYELVALYEQDSDLFPLPYQRDYANHRLNPSIEQNILAELQIEKEKVIEKPSGPTKWYNYSYIRNQLAETHHQRVSVPTIIRRAKQNGYWQPKPPKIVHDREVIMNYAGELIQHDTSYHLFAPDGHTKWYLITSLDDYSRKILYADFVLRETAWIHILALQRVILAYGVPLQYYPDQPPHLSVCQRPR